MKQIKRKILIIVACLMLGTTQAYALDPSTGIVGENGELLGKVTSFAGGGYYQDAEEAVSLGEASFRNPSDMIALADGSFLVSDTSNHVIRRIAEGKVTIFAGFNLLEKDDYGLPIVALLDGPKEEAVFNNPLGLTVDALGNVYIADSGNHAIRKLDIHGNVTTIAGDGISGFADGHGAEARFHFPTGLALSRTGELYVADSGNHAIRVIDREGNVTTLTALSERIVEIIPGVIETTGDYADGPLAEALFNEPYDLVFDEEGNLFVSDMGNHLIRHINLQKQEVSTVAGSIRTPFYDESALYAQGDFVDGDATVAAFNAPKGLTLMEDGSLLISDSLNHTIRLFKDDVVTTIAGHREADHGDLDGINGYHSLFNPTATLVTGEGFLIVDSHNQLIRQYTPYALPSELMTLEKGVHVVLNDQLINFEHAVTVEAGRTMLAAQEIASALDLAYVVTEDQASVEIINDLHYKFEVENLVLTIEDREESTILTVPMDVAPYEKDWIIYVPIRFLAEALGLAVDWHADSETVILRTK